MTRYALMFVAALLVVLHVGSADNSSADPKAENGIAKAPVDNWGDWWPKAQFVEGQRIDLSGIAKAKRFWERIDYGAVETPWGHAFASLVPAKGGDAETPNGLRFWLSWSRAGESIRGEKTADLGSPKAGEVAATMVGPAKFEREQTNEKTGVSSWVGGSLGMTGSVDMEFDFLPADFDDYWIRVDCRKERHWFLVPYALCSDPAKELPAGTKKRSSPVRPANATPDDQVRTWSSVEYSLGRDKENNRHVSARITNRFDTALTLELYQENERWLMATPRTTAAWLWPGGYIRYASLLNIKRDLAFRRWDSYDFWRTPQDVPTWGLLRVTVEEQAYDIAVPSSLYFYTHGTVQSG